MGPYPLPFGQVATILHYAYGITRDNEGTAFSRPFRTVPSAGALYPLEIFFHGTHIEGLQPRPLPLQSREEAPASASSGGQTYSISNSMVQPNIPHDPSIMIFITAIFEGQRSNTEISATRFALIEAGHVAQNINLVSAGFGLGCLNIGGFFDREVDDLLGLDGIGHSTIYAIAIGKSLDRP